jgi:hypothetical protein
MKPRNRLLGALLVIAFACAAIGISVADERQLLPEEPLSELRIAYQKGGPLLILKSSGRLDARLAALGVQVRWAEFPSGPPLLEALNAGALDFGVAGNAATVFAQGAADSQSQRPARQLSPLEHRRDQLLHQLQLDGNDRDGNPAPTRRHIYFRLVLQRRPGSALPLGDKFRRYLAHARALPDWGIAMFYAILGVAVLLGIGFPIALLLAAMYFDALME